MTTTLRQGPNGPFIEIDPQMLEEAGFGADANVELRREGDRIVISSTRPADEADPDREIRFQEAMQWTFERYDETFRKLSEYLMAAPWRRRPSRGEAWHRRFF